MSEDKMRVPRARLERLTSAATAFVALQRMRQHMEGAHGIPRISVGGVEQTGIDLDSEIDLLEQDVIAMRQDLGWRK